MKTLLLTLTIFLLTGGMAAKAQAVPPAALIAAKAMLRNLEHDFPAFTRQVHPTLGLTYYESGKSLHAGRAFQKSMLFASWQSGRKDAQLDSDMDSESGPYVVNTAQYIQEQARNADFAAAKDIRYNITKLPNSTDRFRKAQPGESLVSFHVNESGNDLGWNCLVLRMRKEGTNYYVSGIDYLYWTP